MDLPYELRILPPQAIDVLRFLKAQPGGQADADAICAGADLSDRAFGKAIRRLVTRNYLSMDDAGVYHLTPEGRRAAATVGELPDEDGAGLEAETASAVTRRLTVVLPKVLAVQTPATCYVGIDAPNDVHAAEAVALALRVEAVNAEVDRSDHTLDVPPDRAAQPISFVVTAPQAGAARVRVRAFQMAGFDATDIGGVYVDVDAAPPDAADSALQAFGVDLELQPVS